MLDAGHENPMIFNANQDLEPVIEAALARSATTGKKLLVEYGGDWCPWSLRMAAILARPEFAALLRRHFIFLRCYVGPDGRSNSALIEYPPLSSVPYFSLVDSQGRIIATRDTEGFERLWWFYSAAKIRAFLQDWAGR